MNKIINKGMEAILGSMFVFMLVLTIWQVASRFIFNDPSTFTEEALRFLIILLVIIGSGYATHNDLHFGMTLFSGALKGKKKKAIIIFNQAISLLFNVSVFIFGGYVSASSNMTQISPVLGIPLGIVYGAFTVSGFICAAICLVKIKETLTMKEAA
ncbi:TRAP transporter small permease subunit [Enterovibrio sp. ZSDZ35]|uniref:TRAP transporter small permease protein n=1 Tax=Enterovibrio qingdaonensis TaxID=2899818 RepID=A0ABT5QJ19_9GAMM|nr:TRAP transporter small permease subunit [Enterovibrio sp. ZSDZ35]MDD1780983.1 TRAP transporter small permease subunit [Enterovibrio sp. ZSDZ35]